MNNNKSKTKTEKQNRSYFYNEFKQKFYGSSENKAGQVSSENRSFGEPLAKEAIKQLKEKLEFC
jgi:hypothetical protein